MSIYELLKMAKRSRQSNKKSKTPESKAWWRHFSLFIGLAAILIAAIALHIQLKERRESFPKIGIWIQKFTIYPTDEQGNTHAQFKVSLANLGKQAITVKPFVAKCVHKGKETSSQFFPLHNGNIRIDGYSERFLTFSATLSINLDEKGNIHLVSALQQGIDLKELFSSFQWFFAAPDGTLFPSQEFITETCIYATPAGETVDKPDGAALSR